MRRNNTTVRISQRYAPNERIHKVMAIRCSCNGRHKQTGYGYKNAEDGKMLNSILLIEQEAGQVQKIELILKAEGYWAQTVSNSQKALSAVVKSSPDLVIVSSNQANQSAAHFCQKLKQQDWHLAILFLGASQDICDRIAGLEAGADDYAPLSISAEELLARVRAKLRRRQWETETVCYKYADLQLNTQTREVYRGYRRLDLTAKEFDLLTYFVAHPQQVLHREQILKTIWQETSCEVSNVIDVYIRYLRVKLESAGESRLIHTVRSIGYVLRKVEVCPAIGLSFSMPGPTKVPIWSDHESQKPSLAKILAM